MRPRTVTPADLKTARLFAIKTLDDYHFSLAVICEVLRISPKTVQRYRERLVNRPSGRPDPEIVLRAAWIVIFRSHRAGIKVRTIAAMLNLTQRRVSWTIGHINRYLLKTPSQDHQWVADRLLREEPMVIRSWNELRRVGSSDEFMISDRYDTLGNVDYWLDCKGY